MLLNFLFLPMGYFYLKSAGRFMVGLFFAVLSIPFFSLLTWFFALFLPAVIIAPLIVVLSFGLVITIAIDSYRLSRRAAPAQTWRIFSKPHAFWFIPVFIVFLGAAGFFLEPWEKPFAGAHNIPSPSMEPNIQVGDLVYVNYMADRENLQRSDIVIHRGQGPNKDKRLIKRIVAIPGDRIKLITATIAGDGRKPFEVTRFELNGKIVPLVYAGTHEGKFKLPLSRNDTPNSLFVETVGNRSYYILEEQSGFTPAEGESRELVMGPNEFFLMGDNRDHAADSRYEGTVLRSQIIGRYMHTYFSLFIPNPECEMRHPVLLLWQKWTAEKTSPCHSVAVRWEKAGSVPPLWFNN